MPSPTSKTLALIREHGLEPWPVERFNQFSGRRTDLFNIIDYLVITELQTIGIQSCGTGFADHIKKLTIDERERTVEWLRNPGRKLILIGWRKLLKTNKDGKKGKVKMYYPRIAFFNLEGKNLTVTENKK